VENQPILDYLNYMIVDSLFQHILGLKVENIDAVDETIMVLVLFDPEIERDHGSHQHHDGVIASLIDVVAENGRLDPVIDKELPLEETAEAERLLEDREVFGKVLLKP